MSSSKPEKELEGAEQLRSLVSGASALVSIDICLIIIIALIAAIKKLNS